jgi:hypothetical protein
LLVVNVLNKNEEQVKEFLMVCIRKKEIFFVSHSALANSKSNLVLFSLEVFVSILVHLTTPREASH